MISLPVLDQFVALIFYMLILSFLVDPSNVAIGLTVFKLAIWECRIFIVNDPSKSIRLLGSPVQHPFICQTLPFSFSVIIKAWIKVSLYKFWTSFVYIDWFKLIEKLCTDLRVDIHQILNLILKLVCSLSIFRLLLRNIDLWQRLFSKLLNFIS